MSTTQELIELLEAQVDSGATDTTTDPTEAQLVIYLNKAQRKIATAQRPQELLTATAVDHNITEGDETVSLDSSLILPTQVFYLDSNNGAKELNPRSMLSFIDSGYFKTSNNRIPSYWDFRNKKLVFDAGMPRTATAALKVFGVLAPTALSKDTPSTDSDFTDDWDLLIVYTAAYLYFQKEQDVELMSKFEALALREKSNIQSVLKPVANTTLTYSRKHYCG